MENFKPDSLVWAKFEDYPHWPARIASSDVTEQLRAHKNAEGTAVLFFGSKLSYALVNDEDIEDFASAYDRYSTANETEEFKNALKMANDNPSFSNPPLIILHRNTIKKSKNTKPCK